MDDLVSVPIETLRQAMAVLLGHLEATEGPEVQLEHDYFWAISPNEIYDVYNEPRDFTIGQLSECLSNLESIVAEPSTTVSFALVWFGELAKAIGQSLVR